MTVREALAAAEQRLTTAGVDTPRVDAELLVAHVLGMTRTQVYADLTRRVDGLEPLLARRERREPLAYVLGEWGFRRLTLKTDARALVPRPETEIVVERALALLDGTSAPRVLDVGVGSGAIALALKDERPDAQVTGVDVSEDALASPARTHSGWASTSSCGVDGVETAGEGWDLVVSNPPYVDSLAGLQPELRYEPEVALVGSGLHEPLAGARTYRRARARGRRRAGGGGRRCARVAGYRGVRITPDLAGIDRVVEGVR